ncbi:MAG: helix-turn-helix domain-containing protein [Actinomycetota bacterium]|nr:helix-turn-helix domain-containing protein [Actinomycetota bacterium]
MEDVGREVRRLREERGWSQAKLAAGADMAVSGISQIETGVRSPSAATLTKLARAFGVEVADLFPKAQAPLPLEVAEPSGHTGSEEKPPPVTVSLGALEARVTMGRITVEVEELQRVLRLVESSQLTAEDGMRLLKSYAA